MKKQSGWDRFRLTDAEKEELWRRIGPAARGQAGQRQRASGRGRSLFRPFSMRPVPALIGGAVALTLAALVIGQFAVRGHQSPRVDVARVKPGIMPQAGPAPVIAPPSAKGEPAATRRRESAAVEPSPAPAAQPSGTTVANPGPESAPRPSAPGSLEIPPAEAPVTTTEPVLAEREVHVQDASKGASEQKITSERVTTYALDSIEDHIAKQAGVVMRNGEIRIRGGRSDEVSMHIDSRTAGAAGSPPAAAAPMQDRSAGLYEDRAKASRGLSLAERDRLERERDEAEARVRAEQRERDDYEREFRARCWIPPQPDFDMMYFKHTGINPFVLTRADALSTFGLDVDNASYTVTRAYIERGQLPPQAAVRVEEFVNFFKQDYPPADEGDFRIVVDGAPSPFHEGYYLLRVGLRARDVRPAARKPASLTLVIDVSASMNRENRLELVKRAVRVLLDQLEPSDTIGIVTYTTEARVVLEPTRADHRDRIESVLDELHPQHTTNLDEGLEFGYRMARSAFRPGAINRIVLCTDGVANEGITNAEGILDHVRREADAGIHLTAIGVGMGNYNDVLLEKLADKGDGNYYYVDSMDEARRVFGERLTSTLQTVAKDAKVQVEFDPDAISRWRLIGYEKRALADRDFRNDAVDAGEVGAGHQVTALYEIKLGREEDRYSGEWEDARSDLERGREFHDGGRLGVVRLRYREPESEGRAAGLVREQAEPFAASDLSRSFRQAPERLRLDAAVAEFAEILRGSYWARGDDLHEVARIADDAADDLGHDADVAEFARLVHRAAALHGDRDDPER